MIDGIRVGPDRSASSRASRLPRDDERGRGRRDRRLDPAAVVVKGDLTARRRDEEYDAFLECYGGAFGDRLHDVRGNHDALPRPDVRRRATVEVDAPRCARSPCSTRSIPAETTGRVTGRAARVAGRPRAPARSAGAGVRPPPPVEPRLAKPQPDDYFGIDPDDSERPRRGRRPPPVDRRLLRRAHAPQPGAPFAATGDVPWVEVACVKDFPGRGPSTGCTRVASSRSHRRSRRPRRSGVDRADPRDVRRRLRDVRVRRARGPVLHDPVR